MSKVGKKPVLLKPGCIVEKNDGYIVVKGPLGEIKIKLFENIDIEVKDADVLVSRKSEVKKVKSMHGTTARLLQNAILGTTIGFFKELEIVGTGYWAKIEGNDLVLALGYSHQIRFPTPEGIKIEAKDNKIKVFGIDKEKVGVVADKIKRFRMPDSYKGKGIRYLGEKLRLKPGKAAAKTTGSK